MESELEGIQAARQHYRQREAQRRAEREAERQAWLQRVREAVPRIAAQHPGVHRVVLFGSLVKPARFRQGSDIDLAVVCDSPEVESAFWREVERALGRSVDLRPLSGLIAEVAEREGEELYGRQDSHPGK